MQISNSNLKNRYRVSLRCKLLMVYMISLALGTVNIPIGGSILKYIAILPVLSNIFYILKKKVIRINKIYIMYMIYVVLILGSLLYTNYFSVVFNKFITMGLFVVLLITSSCIEYNDREMLLIKKSYIWASRLTAILTLALGGTIEAGRLTLNGKYFVEDPNYLCGYFLFAIIFITNEIIDKKREKLSTKLTYILEIIMYLYIILISGSRGGLIALGITYAVYLLLLAIKSKKDLKTIVSYIAMIITLVVAFNIIIRVLPTEISSRFNIDRMIESRGTGRIDLWIEAGNIYNSSSNFNKIFGHGIGAIRLINVNGYSMSNAVHNFWIEELVEQGWIGFTLMVSINLYCLYITLKKKDYVLTSVLIGIIGLTMSLSLRAFKPWWNIIIIISILCNSNTKNKQI